MSTQGTGARIRTRDTSSQNVAPLYLGTRINSLNGQPYLRKDYILPSGNSLRDFTTETCVDATHKRVAGRWIEGGPLQITRTSTSYPLVSTSCWISSGSSPYVYSEEYSGKAIPIFYHVPTSCILVDGTNPAGHDVSSYGPKAYNMYRPNFQVADLAVFLAELRDAPRMLMIKAKDFCSLKGASGQYLNAEFGWKPFLSDVRKLIKTYHNIDRHIRSAIRANGKWMLRKGTVVSESKSLGTWEGASYGALYPAFPTHFYAYVPRYSGHARWSQHVWFSGRFRMYIPNVSKLLDHGSRERSRFLRRLFGLRVTPSVVWEIIPWSRLVDYFTNVGDIIENLSNSGDCVAKYAYLMGHTRQECIQHVTWKLKGGPDCAGLASKFAECKSRIPAGPFDFGMSDDLSIRQLAILAALGINRM